MTKKILVGLIAALFFILVGLLALFFANNTSTNKKNSVLIFVPTTTEFILRVTETSQNANDFFSNPIVKNCLNFSELQAYWSKIDSLTSRNYKTSEILQNNTSYICVDTSFNYLFLVDLNKKTNEHFIDQFLANSTSSKKIERCKEGFKAFYPNGKDPVYYFVKHSVFALSTNRDFIHQALLKGQDETVDSEIQDWDSSSDGKFLIWGKANSEKNVLNYFLGEYPVFHSWLDKLSTTYWFNIGLENNELIIKGSLKFDSLNIWMGQFNKIEKERSYPLYNSDTASFHNYYFNLLTEDSAGNQQPMSFMYYFIEDSLDSQFLVSSDPVATSLYGSIINDTSVQIISMADDYITQIAVFNRDIAAKILPIIPFDPDTGKLFGTIYNNYLFIANSTEVMLSQAPNYPNKNFLNSSLKKEVFMTFTSQLKGNGLYTVETTFSWMEGDRVSFISKFAFNNTN